MIEIPYVFVQTLVYTLITYAMLFFEWTATKFLWYFYCVFCLIIGFAYYGMMMVALTANEQLATIAATFFYSVFNLYAGFMIPLPVGTLLLTHDQGFFFFFNFEIFWPQKLLQILQPLKNSKICQNHNNNKKINFNFNPPNFSQFFCQKSDEHFHCP